MPPVWPLSASRPKLGWLTARKSVSAVIADPLVTAVKSGIAPGVKPVVKPGVKPVAKPAANRPAGDPLITKRMAECASYQERLEHALEHGAPIPQALAETKAFLLTAPGVDQKSVEATGVGILYKSSEGLSFYLRIPFDRLPGIK